MKNIVGNGFVLLSRDRSRTSLHVDSKQKWLSQKSKNLYIRSRASSFWKGSPAAEKQQISISTVTQQHRIEMAPTPILVAALLLFVSVGSVQGLVEEGTCTYNVTVREPCGRCCSGGCALTYQVTGMWKTESCSESRPRECRKSCAKHARQCNAKCRCVAGHEGFRNKNVCKCVPSNRNSVRVACGKECRSAFKECASGCAESSESSPCALAETKVNFVRTYTGKCNYIPRPFLSRQFSKEFPKCEARGGLEEAG